MHVSIVRPSGFSDIELASLAVWFVGSGQWQRMDFSEQDAQQLIVEFFKSLKKDDPESALTSSYLSLQNTFMAMRRGTFEAIQSEPPFSRFGKAVLKGTFTCVDPGRRARVS